MTDERKPPLNVDLNPVKVEAKVSPENVDNFLNKIGRVLGAPFLNWYAAREATATRTKAIGEGQAAIIKAETEARIKLMETNATIQAAELERQAMAWRLAEDMRHHANLKAIVSDAVPMLESGSNPNKMDDDWLSKFFSEARWISDEEMQLIWARILAGEANQPGSFSKRTINTLAEVGQREAEMLRRLCGFAVSVLWEPPQPYVFWRGEEIYRQNGVGLIELGELEAMGIISIQDRSGYNLDLDRAADVMLTYFNHRLWFKPSDYNPRSMKVPMGEVRFTTVGSQLASICQAEEVPGFVEFLATRVRTAAVKLHLDVEHEKQLGNSVPAAERKDA